MRIGTTLSDFECSCCRGASDRPITKVNAEMNDILTKTGSAPCMDRVMNAWMKMHEQSIPPDQTTYLLMIRAAVHDKKFSHAFRYYRQLQKVRCRRAISQIRIMTCFCHSPRSSCAFQNAD